MGSNGSLCLVTVDGTDFPIQEPKPFSPIWYSHKFKGAGLRYEVAVSIQTGWIVWLNGPYPAGQFNDHQIADDNLHLSLDPGERYLGDRIYYAKSNAHHHAVTNHMQYP